MECSCLLDWQDIFLEQKQNCSGVVFRQGNCIIMSVREDVRKFEVEDVS